MLLPPVGMRQILAGETMAKAGRSCRIGADIGGTFTDVALEVDGAITSTKMLTDYAAPERAIVEGMRRRRRDGRHRRLPRST